VSTNIETEQITMNGNLLLKGNSSFEILVAHGQPHHVLISETLGGYNASVLLAVEVINRAPTEHILIWRCQANHKSPSCQFVDICPKHHIGRTCHIE
jgi:hypothetical protein